MEAIAKADAFAIEPLQEKTVRELQNLWEKLTSAWRFVGYAEINEYGKDTPYTDLKEIQKKALEKYMAAIKTLAVVLTKKEMAELEKILPHT
jgi:hypothetical protein